MQQKVLGSQRVASKSHRTHAFVGHVRIARPDQLFQPPVLKASPEAIALEQIVMQTDSSTLDELNRSKMFRPKSAAPNLWDDSVAKENVTPTEAQAMSRENERQSINVARGEYRRLTPSQKHTLRLIVAPPKQNPPSPRLVRKVRLWRRRRKKYNSQVFFCSIPIINRCSVVFVPGVGVVGCRQERDVMHPCFVLNYKR